MKKYKEPQIYIVNNSEIAEKLRERYVIAEGNLGTLKQIKYNEYENRRFVNLEYNLVNNLHEYRVVIIDMQNKRMSKECSANEKPNGLKCMYQIDYPEDEFEPAPFVMDQISKEIGEESLRIIFSDKDYKIVEILSQKQVRYYDFFTEDIYGTIGAYVSNKAGKKIKGKDSKLARTIAKYVVGYNVIFDLPLELDLIEQGCIRDEDYFPLVCNQDGEVIAYLGYRREMGYELLLPLCRDKEKLIDELLSQVLPEILSEIFPESKDFQWINSKDFKPKEMLEYEKKKVELTEKYKKQLLEIETQEKEICDKYQFLNDLLVETGDSLVNAVCKYLGWLGYSDVQKIDGQEEILREDIQVIDGNALYIIEVKGIGGTSTDAECSQVAKHRRKREKENRDKDVFPIYIVNHQRYMQPQLRENPPFSKNQIDYAESDERGLLTTWQLYQQFFKKPNACIVKIKDVEIIRNDYIWANKGDIWKKGKICSIQIDDKNVNTAKNGEVGLVLDIELAKGFKLFGKRGK